MSNPVQLPALAMLGLACLALAPPATAEDCTCARLIESSTRCFRSIWPHFADADPQDQDQLETLLDAMWEGNPGGQPIETAECAEMPDDACAEACQLEMWSAFVDLARAPRTPQEGWGATILAFCAYMDIGAPPEVEARLERLANELLAGPRDRVATATVLRVMEYYDFQDRTIMQKLLMFMGSEDRLIRDLAYQRFSGFTGCTLKFDAEADRKRRDRQARKIQNWWTTRGE